MARVYGAVGWSRHAGLMDWLRARRRGDESRGAAAARIGEQLIDRVRELGERLVRRADKHPRLSDAALAAVLLVVTLPDAVGSVGDQRVAVALHVALWIPLAFRRRAPLFIFYLLCAVAFLQWLTRIELAADLSLIIALYTVAVHRRRGSAVMAAAVLAIGAVLAAVVWSHEHETIRSFVQLSGVVAAAFLLGVTVRIRNVSFALLTERAERLERERDQQAQIAAAAERTRIAREMHDIVAHSLSVMITLADGAMLTDRTADARAAMRQVSRTGRDALADTRRVLGVLRDQRADAELQPQPMISDVEALITAVRATGMTVETVVRGAIFAPTPTAQTAVYRIIQEALTNSVKHAGAGLVRIVVTYDAPSVTIDIADDGHTGDTPAGAVVGHGLTGMRERAGMFGGDLTAGPDPSGGWRITTVLHDADGGST